MTRARILLIVIALAATLLATGGSADAVPVNVTGGTIVYVESDAYKSAAEPNRCFVVRFVQFAQVANASSATARLTNTKYPGEGLDYPTFGAWPWNTSTHSLTAGVSVTLNAPPGMSWIGLDSLTQPTGNCVAAIEQSGGIWTLQTLRAEVTPAQKGTITVMYETDPANDTRDLAVTGSGAIGAFVLDTDSASPEPDRRTFSDLDIGNYTVTGTLPNGYTLTSLACVDASGGTTVSSATATIGLAVDDSVTCTYKVSQRITLKGSVRNRDGLGLPGIGISYLGPNGQGNVTTAVDGTWSADVAPGTYTVTAPNPPNINEPSFCWTGNTNQCVSTATVTAPAVVDFRQDRPPKAEIVVERTSENLTTYTFDAGNSTDPDGDPITYLWDFGDRTSSTEEFVLHVYPDQPREYRVTLTATAKGLSNTAVVTVEVGAFALRGQLFEQVCGNNATRAPITHWRVIATGSSYQNRQVSTSPYEFFALRNDQVVIRPDRAESHDDNPRERDMWPEWRPIQRRVFVAGDTTVDDFVHCFGPNAPRVIDVIEYNKTYILQDGVTVRSGGTIRVCTRDDFSFRPFGIYASSGAAVEFTRVPGMPNCRRAVVVNNTSKIEHLSLYDSLHPRMFQDIVILP